MHPSECERRVTSATQEAWAMSERHRTGCTSHADCVSFEPRLRCVSTCLQPVLASEVSKLQGELSRLDHEACTGLRCGLATDCAAYEMPVCWSGVCVRGFADGGPEN